MGRSIFSAAMLFAALAGCDASGTVRGGAPLSVDPCAATGNAATWSALYTCYFGPTGKANCAGQSTCHGGSSQTGTITSGFDCSGSSTACWRSMTQCAAATASPDASDDAGPEAGDDAGPEGGIVDAGDAAPAEAGVEGGADAGSDGGGPRDGGDGGVPDAADGGAVAVDGGGDAGAFDSGSGVVEGGSACSCSAAFAPIASIPCGSTDPSNTMLLSVLRGAGGHLCPDGTGPLCMPFSGGYTFTQDDVARISAWIRAGAQND